ncbi:MAG TPA: hypothetical protein VKB76_14120, partial [Ktedonobacterales bacterium]|nr:hypothetical protein [Ktedonobacterales bacterium]
MSKSEIGIALSATTKSAHSWEMATIAFPLLALVGWSFSLSSIHVSQMNDLGIISVMPPLTIASLILLQISFAIQLRQEVLSWPKLLLHLLLLIFMLYSITTLIESEPRFSVVYRHAGYTEYIMRTGGVDPMLDAYFNWPGFFILAAFVTKITGLTSILAYAAWSPVFLNLIYLGPLYMIFRSCTSDQRHIWLALWIFFLTNWIGQDYFSPQGINFFFYLVIVAILLTWFRAPAKSATSPDQAVPEPEPASRRSMFNRPARIVRDVFAWLAVPDENVQAIPKAQSVILLGCLIICFAFVVFSHPLTPFFTIASVSALAYFRRITPRWLPILMMVMTFGWIFFMTRAYLAGHLDSLTGGIGQLSGTITANVTDRVIQGDAEHDFIAAMRVGMTLLVWLLAAAGAWLRLRRGHRDATLILLATVPFALIVAQSYGGEMLLRIYLFTLPAMVFFVAAPYVSLGTHPVRRSAAISLLCLALLGGFFFTRYGNERNDYITQAEVMGVAQLYRIAQPHSLLIQGWEGTPWKYQEFESFDYL